MVSEVFHFSGLRLIFLTKSYFESYFESYLSNHFSGLSLIFLAKNNISQSMVILLRSSLSHMMYLKGQSWDHSCS